jgi:hypothetical protein
MKKLITAALLLLVWVGSAMGHYLTVDEQSTYIDVACDGYIFRCYYGNVETWDQVRNAGDTATLIYFYNQIYSSGTAYDIRFDLGSTLEVIEHTPTRVVLRKTAEFEDTNQNSLDASDVVVVHYYIYSDKIIMDLSWQDDATTTIDNSSNNYTMRVWVNGTSTINIGGDGGTEYCHTGGSCGNTTDLTSTEKSDYEYLGVECDELTLMYIDLNHTDDSDFQQYFGNTGVIGGQWNNNASFPSGAHRMVGVWIIDSADREGSAKLYTSTERLEMGDQWKDTTIADPTTGSWVDDLVIPANVGVDGFASDGALHSEPTSKEAEFTNDITRHKQAVVFEDPHIYTGDTVSGATDHLVGYWPCDDNAASTTIVASVGSNGTLQGGDNTADKDNADAVQGTSLLMNGTDDYLDFDSALGDLADTDKLTVSFWFKPNFAYNVGSDEGILEISDGTDVVQLEYNATTDNFILTVNLTSSATISTAAYTSDAELQRWHHCMIAIDASQEVAVLVMDGQVVGVDNTAQAWGSTPNEFTIGYDGNSYGPVYVDNVAIYDGALLPYGAFFTGNGSVDTAVAHDDVLFYWDGNDATGTNVEIGSVQGTEGGSGGTFQTSGGLGNNADYYDTEGTAELHFSITTEDIIDFSQGTLSMWFNLQTISASDALFGVGDADDYIQAVIDGSGNIDVTYRSQSTSETITGNIACGTGEWHHLLVTWDDTDQVKSYIDGVENGTAQDIASTYAGATSDTIYFGADYAGSNIIDAYIDEVYITNNPNTPQIPTIMGKPVHIPLIEVE